MKTKIDQIDGLELALQYQTAVVVGSDIQVTDTGGLPIKFKLTSDVSGTITVNALPLKDVDGTAITSLENGLYEVVYDTGFFTLKPSGGGETNFLMKYDGSNQTLLDLKGSPVNVNVGDYVYNEFNYTKLLGAENLLNIDKTTPVQVVNAAYDTSGNGGRKLVRLDNGWLIAGVRHNTSNVVYVYKSIDNGATWNQLATLDTGNITTSGELFALSTKSNKLYIIYSTGTTVRVSTYDAISGGATIPIGVIIDSAQTATGAVSITIDSNGHLHAAWASKNATYPNSFNIRYSKSTDGGVTWASPIQVTVFNTSGVDGKNPSIVIANDGNPKIVYELNGGGSNNIRILRYDGASWSSTVIYTLSGYTQVNPSATVDSNGVLHVAWAGTDSGDATFNIRYSISSDNGATWSAMEKITPTIEPTAGHRRPSITTDINNKPHIVYDSDGSGCVVLVHKISGTWSNGENLSGNSGYYPSVCDNYKDFEKPLVIWLDSTNAKVEFYGKWTEDLTPVQIIPPMSLATVKTDLQALYADTLKMHNPTTDARYQGFVSKKDLWTVALQELQWTESNLKLNTNLFGKVGTVTPYEIASGENVLAVSQNIVYVTVASMTKIRETRVTMAGTYKVTFGLSAHGTSNTAVGRIYVNGVARGTTRTKTDATVTYYDEDLTLNANDLVQIYASSVVANGAGITGFSIKTSLPFPKGEIIL